MQVSSSMIIPVALGLLAIVFIVWIVSTHNRFVYLQNLIRESWAGIDIALKRRHDLIPNLVETVKGYAAHESSVFERVTQAREKAVGALGNVENLVQHEQQLVSAVNMLMARVEAYPQLKASEHFAQLQQELIDTEDRISAARRLYNGNVREFNTYLQSFPASLLAGNRKSADFFEVEEIKVREPIPVKF
ncbi:MAG: LemA family protein [Fimbriimonadaceae bacterium]|nr:LemA family protein [Fimbriimonadaceae bacterium]